MAAELPADGSAMKKIKLASRCFMGGAHLLYLKDYLKGALFALLEVVFIALIPLFFCPKIFGLITLGEPQPNLPPLKRDNSVFMLIDGILAIAVMAIFVITYFVSLKSAEKTYEKYCITGEFPQTKHTLNDLASGSFPLLGLAPSVLMLIIFVVVPLVFSMCVAFTNYSAPDHIPPGNTVDWVGLENFKALTSGGTNWSKGFGRVALWTVLWAFFATTTCYIGGLLIAVMLREAKIKFDGFFRIIFILPYAVPSVVTMITWRNLLNGSFGTVNRTLQMLGLIKDPIPWLGSPLLAQVMCIVINLWAGFGYFMMLSMGSMTAIGADLYEASKIDGASAGQTLRKITIPLVMYQTMPQIIMSFTHNLNNFGIIFFLTGGNPPTSDSTTTLAGATDILVTWIYKLTMTLLKYNYASVIAVLIFVVMAPFAIISFRNTKSFKEGEI